MVVGGWECGELPRELINWRVVGSKKCGVLCCPPRSPHAIALPLPCRSSNPRDIIDEPSAMLPLRLSQMSELVAPEERKR